MSDSMTSGALSARRPDLQRPGRLAGWRARLHRGALDRDLACGIAPWRSSAHAARALQLTGPRHRETCAEGLEQVLGDTERPRRMGSVVLADPAAVLLCAPVIWEIVGTLRSPEPVSAEGMARLRMILCDGAGPLYAAGHADELRQALGHIARWLPVVT